MASPLSRAAAPGQVRLIGGRFKRSKLPVPALAGLRPTPDRVRETLFNWLGQDLSGWRCLDAFAGSGALGLEAASRGAAAVVLLERNGAQARQLQATALRLQAPGVVVHAADALAWMRRAAPACFDLVFLDPPFDAGLHLQAIAAALPLLAAEGLLYVEAADATVPPSGWRAWRSGQAGQVHYQVWRRTDNRPS